MKNKDILLNNLTKIHTTKLGSKRISKNLNLPENNIINYCKNKILTSNCNIYKKGKIDQQIGGCGLYRTGFDYAPRGGKFVHDGAQEYYFLRRGITNLYKTFYERQKSKPKTNESK